MKETTVKISVTQDGLLPEEVTVLGTIFLPAIQKQILKSCGFEKIDDATYAGVMPIKVTTNQKTQIIEFEVGAMTDFRKKVVNFVNQARVLEFEIPEPPVVEEPKKISKRKSTKKSKLTAKEKKAAAKKKTAAKKTAAKKTPAKKKAAIKIIPKRPRKSTQTKKKVTAKKTKKTPVKIKKQLKVQKKTKKRGTRNSKTN
tara:strand:- start:385 stop:981 length:597 start_codon:yes stop_codon:yes gene_type:complete